MQITCLIFAVGIFLHYLSLFTFIVPKKTYLHHWYMDICNQGVLHNKSWFCLSYIASNHL